MSGTPRPTEKQKKGSPPEPSALLLLSPRAALAAAAAFVVMRVHISGIASEMTWPSTNAAVEAVGWVCVAFAALAALAPRTTRLPAGRRAAPVGRVALGGLGVLLLAVLLAAVRASAPDLAARTAVSWLTNAAVAVAVFGLVRAHRPLARELVPLLAATALSVCALALYEYFVEWPEMLAVYEKEKDILDAIFVPQEMREAFALRLDHKAAKGPFLLPNLMGAFLVTVGPLALAVPLVIAGAPRASLRARVPGVLGALGVAALLLAGLLTSRAKGASLAACVLVAVAGLIVATRRSRPLGLALAGVLLLASVAVLTAGVKRWRADPEALGVGLSLQVRLEYHEAAFSMIADHPLGGVGLGGFRDRYPAYRPERAEETKWAHDDAVQIAAETGLFGLAGLLAMIGGLLACGARGALERDRPPSEPSGGDGDAPPTPDDGAGADAATAVAGSFWQRLLAESGGAIAATALGVAVGALLTGGFDSRYGDPDGAARIGLLVLLAWVGLRLAVEVGGLGRRVAADRVVLAAAVVATCGLAVSSLLDFPFYAHGIQASFALLWAMALALATVPEDADAPRALALSRTARGAIALGVTTVALLFALFYFQPMVDADAAEKNARSWLFEARGLAPEGGAPLPAASRDAAVALLERARERYRDAAAAWPSRPRPALGEAEASIDLWAVKGERSAALDAIAALERARRLAPEAAGIAFRLAEAHLAFAGWRPDGGAAPPAAATAAIEDALALYPTHPRYRLRHAQMLDTAGRRDLASKQAAAARRLSAAARNPHLVLDEAELREVAVLTGERGKQ